MPTINQELQQALEAVEAGSFPRSGPGFGGRAEALDYLELHVLDRLEILGDPGSLPGDLEALRALGLALQLGLEAAQARFIRRLRQRILAGRYSPQGLLRSLLRRQGRPGPVAGYDNLDLLTGALLAAGAPREASLAREPEMVFYQPTPARAILAFLEGTQLGQEDHLVDLGSGLGQVSILAALLSGARATGIELEPAYCDYARDSALGLGVGGVEFVQSDVRQAALDSGTVFFLYTPFTGALLQAVLDRLELQARTRSLRVCSYGPCTWVLASQPWLRSMGTEPLHEHEIAIFISF